MLKTLLRQPLSRQFISSRRTQRISKMPLLTISNSIKEGLSKNEIFPDVTDTFEPKGLLTISYGESNDVALGNTLTPEETSELPKFQFTPTESGLIKENDLFTLVLTDPDAPSRTDKKWSEYAHYIQTNIELPQSQDAEFQSVEIEPKGDTVLSYVGPGPPKGTGKHRYVFLLYKQPNGKISSEVADRINWGYGVPATGVKRWARQFDLEPWAVNFFYAQNSDK